VLEEPQELGLHRHRHLADLVEEQGAAGRRLDLAAGPLGGAGERAALVPEQLALEQRLGDRRAVDRHEGPAPTLRALVDAPRQDLLAGAALAQEGHRDLAGGHGLEQGVDLAHRRRAHDRSQDDSGRATGHHDILSYFVAQ
jgi:hypothetical protein